MPHIMLLKFRFILHDTNILPSSKSVWFVFECFALVMILWIRFDIEVYKSE